MKNDLIVKDFVVEQTGGYVYVAWGSFENETYFAISSDCLLIYDADEYKAMEDENYDGYTWENAHTINSYSNDKYLNKEYIEVLKQIYNKCQYLDKNTYDLFSSIFE